MKQESLKNENLVESGGLVILGCTRAHLAGSREAGPASCQRGKGKHRGAESETVLLSKSAQPSRGDQPEKSTVPGWGLGQCSAGQAALAN